MPRKTAVAVEPMIRVQRASMRPRPDAAENLEGRIGQTRSGLLLQ